MKKISIFILFLLFAFSANNSVQTDLVYDFLNLGANARIQALGNTGVVNALDAEATLYNPANLAMYPHKNLVFSLNPLYYETSHIYLFYSMDSVQDPLTRFGLGYIRFSMDGIEERGVSRTDSPLSVFSATDQAFIIATSKIISYSTSIGIGFGIIASDYKDASNDFFMTTGINHINNEIKMKFNGVVQFYNEAGYKFSIGGLHYAHPQFTPSLLIDFYSHNRFSVINLSYGLEYLYSKNLKMLFGFNKDQFSFGIGTTLLKDTDFNYAATFTDLEVRHQYSFSMKL